MHVKDLLSLRGKIILVSGGAGQYGRCIAEGLAEADATVLIASRNLAASEDVAARFRERGLAVYALPLDQADPASVAALRARIEAEYGRLDGFVNNAVARPMKGYDAPIEQFAESMAVNATGMMHLLREVIELIGQSGGGSVISIASIFGLYGPDLSNYEGTDMGDPPPDYFFHNAGLINLNRYLARLHAGRNLRFNCISPGGLFNHQPARFVENYTKKVPLRRMANPDDIKGLVVLLASEAGAYINGENIVMDGGLKA